MRKAAVFIGFLAVSACSQATEAVNNDVTPAKLQSDTAVYFATSKGNVRVGNLKSSLVGTSYQARVGKTLYDCNYFRGTVSCNRAI